MSEFKTTASVSSRFLIYGTLGLVLCAVLGFVGNALDFASFSFWAPKQEAVKRKVFEETPSYVNGKLQDLAKYHHEWVIAQTPVEKKAIEGLVRQQFAEFNRKNVSDPELDSWLSAILSN